VNGTPAPDLSPVWQRGGFARAQELHWVIGAFQVFTFE
jgi:hypothetical protein